MPETYGGKVARILLALPILAVPGTFIWHDTYVGESLRTLPQLALTVGWTLFFTGLLGALRLRRERKTGVPSNKWASFGVAIVLALTFACAHYFAGRAYNVRMIEARFWDSVDGRSGSEGPGGYLYWAKGDSDDEWFRKTFTPFEAHLAEASTKYADARYAEVMAKPELEELRKFRAEFPGVHAVETAAPIAAKYREALKKYDELIAGKANTDPESVKGLRALLSWLAENDVDSTQVPVVFLPFPDLKAEEFEDAVLKSTGAREVAPVSVAFTAEQNAQRTAGVLNRLNDAIRPVAGELFQLTDRSDGVSRARFLVGEKVSLSGSLYSLRDEKEWPISKKKLYIGISMTFDCTIQIPKGSEALDDELEHGFHFQQVAKPAPDIEARGREKLVDADVYGAMAGSAFDDFRDRLIKSYGL